MEGPRGGRRSGEVVGSRTGAFYAPHSRLYCIFFNRLIIQDLLCISPLHSPHCIPLFEPESTGPFGTLADRVLRSFDPGDSSCGTVERDGKLPVLPIGDIGL